MHDSSRRNAVNRFARANALRSTALVTSLALAVGFAAPVRDAWAAKVPLPKPRPIARNIVPKTSGPAKQSEAKNAPSSAAAAPAAIQPATRQHAAVPPPARKRLCPRRWRQRPPRRNQTRTGWKTSSNSCARTNPATQRRRRRRLSIPSQESSRSGLSCAATTMARPSSAIALSSRAIRVGPRRRSCVVD